MQAFLQPRNYDKSTVDFRRDHIVMGGGNGQDLVYQDGKFFTSFGDQITPTKEECKKHGIPYTHQTQRFLERVILHKKSEQLKAKLEEKLAQIEEREKRRIMAGLSGSVTAAEAFDETDTEQEVEDIDLSGIDELLEGADEEELVPDPPDEKPAAPPKVKAKQKPTSRR